MARAGRPSLYTPELADVILLRVSLGETLLTISRDRAMPDRRTIYRWMMDKPDFAARYDRARISQQDSFCDKILDLADQADEQNWQPIQVQIRTYQWVMSKLSRRVYGDDVSLLGGSGPLEIVVRRVGMDDAPALPPGRSAALPAPTSERVAEALDGFELLKNGTQRCVRHTDEAILLGRGDASASDSKGLTGTRSNHEEAKNAKVSSNPGLEPEEV